MPQDNIGDLRRAYEMKTSLVLFILGVLALVAGLSMYVISWHRTIGLAGTGLGIVLLVVGGVMVARERKPAVVQP